MANRRYPLSFEGNTIERGEKKHQMIFILISILNLSLVKEINKYHLYEEKSCTKLQRAADNMDDKVATSPFRSSEKMFIMQHQMKMEKQTFYEMVMQHS